MEPEGSYRILKDSPLASTLSQMNLVHTLTVNFFKIKIIIPSITGSIKWSLPFRFKN
jgi:hypothetical protein